MTQKKLNKQIFIVLMILVWISSCTDFDGERKEEAKLPPNSVTKLLMKRDGSLAKLIAKASAENLEIFKGFRGLKINSRIQDLDFTGWRVMEDKYASTNGIKKFRNNIDVDFIEGDSLSRVTLTFFRDSLKSISINDYDTPFKGDDSQVIPLFKEKIEIVYGKGKKSDISISDYKSLADLLTAEEPLPYSPAIRRTYYESYDWESKNYSLDCWYDWIYLRARQPSGLDYYEIESVRAGLTIEETKSKYQISKIEYKARMNNDEETRKRKINDADKQKKKKLKQTVETF